MALNSRRWLAAHGLGPGTELLLHFRKPQDRAAGAEDIVDHRARRDGRRGHGVGLAPDDPRGLTLTGGLPYFGGPGNSYSLHAIAETVVEMRSRPGQYGLVGANGGIMSKYSVGVYSSTPAPWRPDGSAALQARIDARPRVAGTRDVDGPGTIETYSVRYDWPVRTGIIVGRRDADGSRFLAVTTDDDLVALMSDGDPLGARIQLRCSDGINRAAALPR